MPIKPQRPSLAEAGYPQTYRTREVQAVVRSIQKQQSVLICGLGGSGKSHLLRFLAFHPALADQLTTLRVVRLYLDCNAAIATHAAAIFRALLLETGTQEPVPAEAADALIALRTMLVSQLTPQTHFVIVLDRCERIAPTAQPYVLDGLRHLRDYLNRQVSYVLGSRTPLPIASLSQEFDDLLAEPPVVWVGPLAPEDARWNVRTIVAEQGLTADAEIVAALLRLSGGHPRLLRAITLAWAESRWSKEELRGVRVLRDRQVGRVCENIWRELDELSQRLVQQITQGEAVVIPPEHPLRLYGLVRETESHQAELVVEILADFIRASNPLSHVELTALEQRLWDIVQAQSGTLVQRGDLIDAIYGDDPDGVSDEALTALVARLRRKIEQAGIGKLETVRGQGYRFIPTPRTGVRQ